VSNDSLASIEIALLDQLESGVDASIIRTHVRMLSPTTDRNSGRVIGETQVTQVNSAIDAHASTTHDPWCSTPATARSASSTTKSAEAPGTKPAHGRPSARAGLIDA